MDKTNDEQVAAILARGVARLRAMHIAQEDRDCIDHEGEGKSGCRPKEVVPNHQPREATQ
ncbi:hypothetical protein [Crateriforma spongiae]|uniref:hypothetical protein n=1 Tax=Crateriforma spongiae TaxID=2724528 RepID=UPI0039B0B91F